MKNGILDKIELLNQLFLNAKIWFKDAGIKLCDDSWATFENYISYDSIGYVKQGKIILKINQTEAIIPQGGLYYIPATTKYSHYLLDCDVAEIYWCHFNLQISGQPLIKLIDIPIGVGVLNQNDVEASFLRMIQQISNKQIGGTLKLSGYMTELLADYLSLCSNDVQIKNTQKFDVMNSVFQFINQNLDKNPTVDELAALVGLAPNYFIKLFKRYFDETPIQFILGRKEQFAKEMLTSSNISVKELAGMLGFENQNYFSEFFKKRCGYSPMKYREMKGSLA